MDLCSSTTDALKSRLRAVSNTHRKLWTRCPEIQMTAAQSPVWQVLEQPGLLHFGNLRGWRFHSPSATLFGSVLGSSTFTGISLLLTTSMNFSCHSFWMVLPFFYAFVRGAWLHLPFTHPSRGWKTQFNFPLSCLLFSRWIKNKPLHPLSLHATLSREAPKASPITLTASILAGPLCWPSGWEHHSWVTLLVMDRPGQNNSPIPYHHYLPITCTQECFCHCLKASSRARSWV